MSLRARWGHLARRRSLRQPTEPNEREMTERRHRPALDEFHAAVALGPAREPLPAEFRPPAEPAGKRREAALERRARTPLGAEIIDQDDLAARFEHAGEFVERRLGIRHRGDDVLSDHDVERAVLEAEVL